MLSNVTTRQQPTVNIWIQRLDPTIQNLWKVGYFFNTDGLDTSFVQRLLGPTSRNDFKTIFTQALNERHQVGLIRYAN